jgi:hypothetical protein
VQQHSIWRVIIFLIQSAMQWAYKVFFINIILGFSQSFQEATWGHEDYSSEDVNTFIIVVVVVAAATHCFFLLLFDNIHSSNFFFFFCGNIKWFFQGWRWIWLCNQNTLYTI